MKMLYFLLLLTPFSLYACGGCNDAPAAGANSEIIKGTYASSDSSIEQKLKELKDMLAVTLESENTGKKLFSDALIFQIDSIVSLKELDFLQRKDIKIEVQNEE